MLASPALTRRAIGQALVGVGAVGAEQLGYSTVAVARSHHQRR